MISPWFKYPLIIGLFLICAVFNMSIIPVIAIVGQVPNLVFILFFIIAFFENKHQYNIGFWSALFGGLLLDITLGSYFGVSIGALLFIYFLMKFIAHFIKDWSEDVSIINFALLFSLSFITYEFLLYISSLVLHFQSLFELSFPIVITLAYNLAVASIGFYLSQTFLMRYSNKQLKLL